MQVYSSFREAVRQVQVQFLASAQPVKPKFWQATDVSARPEAQMMEQCFVAFGAQVPRTSMGLEVDVAPNLPWAEDHFLERVGGVPVNPGETWVNWPWSNSADGHRDAQGRFNHNYMERYWPKYAGDGQGSESTVNRGIRYDYGDLNDVVEQLAKDPLTRQAYLPVFFPEDTGAVHGGRVPCSIGYHFLMRDNRLHCTYQLRSCDLYRHFRDDLYLTARLMQWVCSALLDRGFVFNPGVLFTHIGSLHCFINDYHALSKAVPK